MFVFRKKYILILVKIEIFFTFWLKRACYLVILFVKKRAIYFFITPIENIVHTHIYISRQFSPLKMENSPFFNFDIFSTLVNKYS